MIGSAGIQLEKHGFVDLGVLSPELNTLSIAKIIGKPAKISNLSEVQCLSPKSKDQLPRNTYSGNYGLENFPLHTDLAHWHIPPRYFLLRCLVPDPKINTLVLKFEKALEGLSPTTVSRALFKPRRKLNNRQFLLRLVDDEIFRWDSLYLIPENNEAEEASSFINALKEDQYHSLKLAEQGQIILIDNWKVMHGRSRVPEDSTTRLIERVYLSEINL